jgi:uncharacterized protein YndB with AHSA1/START domain
MNAPSAAAVTVKVSRKFKASPERVFDAWLDPEKARQFLFTESTQHVISAKIDARVGGSFLFVVRRDGQDRDHIGEYVEIDRPRRLVFLFSVPASWQGKHRVSIDIVPQGTGCELTVTHENLPPEFEAKVTKGWTAFLENLQTTQFDQK